MSAVARNQSLCSIPAESESTMKDGEMAKEKGRAY